MTAIKQQARAAVPKPAIRLLDRQWDENDISAEAYQEARLGLEIQTQLRLLDKYRKRFELSEREWKSLNAAPMQDHEIGHIWGIPAGSLAGRKVKHLHQYLQSIQTALQRSSIKDLPVTVSLDLWKETLGRPWRTAGGTIIAVYDGLERTEDALVGKLQAFVWGTLGEDLKRSSGCHWCTARVPMPYTRTNTRSLFGLQRLMATLSKSTAGRKRSKKKRRPAPHPWPRKRSPLTDESGQPTEEEVGQMKQHVFEQFYGASCTTIFNDERVLVLSASRGLCDSEGNTVRTTEERFSVSLRIFS